MFSTNSIIENRAKRAVIASAAWQSSGFVINQLANIKVAELLRLWLAMATGIISGIAH
jgi:hypothetical protein